MTPTFLAFPRQAGLAVAAFIAVLLATMIWAVAFSVTSGGLQAEVDTKTRMLQELRARTLPGAEGRSSAAQQAASSPVISAPSETIAASILQKEILASIADSGGSVHSIQAEAVSEVNADGLRRLNAQLTFESSIESLQRLLFTLETGVPFIFIESLAAQPALAAASGEKSGNMLRVTLVASSYWKNIDGDNAMRSGPPVSR